MGLDGDRVLILQGLMQVSDRVAKNGEEVVEFCDELGMTPETLERIV